MSKLFKSVCCCLALVALLSGAAPSALAATDITALRSWRAPDNTRLVLDLAGPVKYRLSPDSTPARLVLEIDDAQTLGPLALPPVGPPLKALRLEKSTSGLRLIIDTQAEVSPKAFLLPPNEKYGHRLVLDLFDRVSTPLVTAPATAPAPVPVSPPAVPVLPPESGKALSAAEKSGPEKAPAPKSAPVMMPPAVPPVAEAKGTMPDAEGRGAQKPALAKPAAATADGSAGAAAAKMADTASGEPKAVPAKAAILPASKEPATSTDGKMDSKASTARVVDKPEKKLAPEKYDASRYRNVIVAIDAGHGGEDPGASGLNGTHEKHVTLAIARELQTLLNAEPGVTAVLTRTGDYFIPLQERRQIARNQHKADIFISIHADAAENRSARGASVFALSLKGANTATSRFARMLAERENRADLIGGAALQNGDDVLRNVLADMVVAGSLDHSLHMGRHILSNLDNVGRLHSPRVEQAGFAVLKEPGMVSLLVETGFISNPDEEANLTNKQYQHDIARAVSDGVRRYCRQFPAPGTYFAWLADSGRSLAAEKPRAADKPEKAVAAEKVDKADAGKVDAAASMARESVVKTKENSKALSAEKALGTARYVKHKVARGENLTRLAAQYRVSMNDLRELNKLADDQVKIGQVLKIPTNQ